MPPAILLRRLLLLPLLAPLLAVLLVGAINPSIGVKQVAQKTQHYHRCPYIFYWSF